MTVVYEAEQKEEKSLAPTASSPLVAGAGRRGGERVCCDTGASR